MRELDQIVFKVTSSSEVFWFWFLVSLHRVLMVPKTSSASQCVAL